MRICRTALLPGTMVIFFLAASAQAQPRAAARLSSEIQKARLSHLRGMTVENRDGERLGVLKEFIVDMPAGDIKYALVSVGGVLGVRSTRKIVPVQALSDATAKAGILALDVSTRRWKKAPQFRRSELRKLSEPQRAGQISTFYSPVAQRSRRAQAAPDNGGHLTPSATGREDEPHDPPNYALASDLIGRDVINQQQIFVGEISDLLIDLAGQKKPFVIISKARLLKRGENYAVPLRLISQSANHRLKIEANGAALTRALPFSEQGWQTTAASSASIYHYAE